jgi:hypothetical protein
MKMKQNLNVKSVLILLGITLGIESLGDVILPAVRVKFSHIEKAIHIYAMTHNGKFPDSLGELFQFASTNYDYGKQPLLKKEDLIDPWGEPFEYEYSEKKYIIRSSGPDRKMGTEDDILEGHIEAYQRGWKPEQTPPVDVQGTNAAQTAMKTGGAQTSPPSHEKPTSTAKTETHDNVEEEQVKPNNLWLYVGISLCILLPILYFMRRKLKNNVQ